MMQCIEAKGIQVGTRKCQSKSSSTELRGLCPSCRGKALYIWVRVSACTPVISIIFYLFTRLVRCSVDSKINCGARKLT
jgi:hypothetical protein